MALRNLFGKSDYLEKLPVELRGLLEDMRRERNAFEATAIRAGSAMKGAEALAEPVAQAQQRLAELHQRLAALEGLEGRFTEASAQLATFTSGQQEAGNQLGETRRLAEAARSELDGLRAMLTEALAFRQEVAEVRDLSARWKDLSAQLGELETAFAEARSRQQEIGRDTAETASRVAAFEERSRHAAAGVEALAARAATLESTAQELRQLGTEMPNTRRELDRLRAVADYVSQKVAVVEGQRDAVERATKGAERLAELVAQVDRQLQEQRTNAGFLEQLEQNVGRLRQLHEALLEQTELMHKRQQVVEEQDRTHRIAFEKLRAEVQDAAAGFAFEREGLAAMNQRVIQLREALGSVEQRLPVLDTATGSLKEAESAAERLAGRVGVLAGEVEKTERQVAGLTGIREVIQRVDASAQALAHRMDELTPVSTRQLEEAEQRVERLAAALTGLEERSRRLDGHGEQLKTMNRELASRQGEADQALAQLGRAAELLEKTGEAVARLEQGAETLERRLAQATEAGARADGLLQDIEQHAAKFEEARARLLRFEAKLEDVVRVEAQVLQSLALAKERQASIEAVRSDLQRLFGIADSTANQVRDIAVLQKEVAERQEALSGMAAQLRELDRQEGRIAERRKQFEEAEQQLAHLDAHLAGLRAMLQTVLDQREFLDKVVETGGNLTFQAMQAEAVLTALREERAAVPASRTSKGARRSQD